MCPRQNWARELRGGLFKRHMILAAFPLHCIFFVAGPVLNIGCPARSWPSSFPPSHTLLAEFLGQLQCRLWDGCLELYALGPALSTELPAPVPRQLLSFCYLVSAYAF